MHVRCVIQLISFQISAVHTNKFPGWKAGMTSFSTKASCQGKLVNFSRTHEQIKLVKEKLSRKNCPSVRSLRDRELELQTLYICYRAEQHEKEVQTLKNTNEDLQTTFEGKTFASGLFSVEKKPWRADNLKCLYNEKFAMVIMASLERSFKMTV